MRGIMYLKGMRLTDSQVLAIIQRDCKAMVMRTFIFYDFLLFFGNETIQITRGKLLLE